MNLGPEDRRRPIRIDSASNGEDGGSTGLCYGANSLKQMENTVWR